jgi:hypothetical protein
MGQTTGFLSIFREIPFLPPTNLALILFVVTCSF